MWNWNVKINKTSKYGITARQSRKYKETHENHNRLKRFTRSKKGAKHMKYVKTNKRPPTEERLIKLTTCWLNNNEVWEKQMNKFPCIRRVCGSRRCKNEENSHVKVRYWWIENRKDQTKIQRRNAYTILKCPALYRSELHVSRNEGTRKSLQKLKDGHRNEKYYEPFWEE